MERLTRRINGVVVYVGAKNPYSTGQIPCEVEPEGVREMMDRLAAYEDTRLSSSEVHSMYGEWNAMMSVLNSIGSYDRLRELAEADKDGRVVVLPCKVGDTVYKTITIKDQAPVIMESQVKTLGQAADIAQLIGKRNKVINVFLTREEAEKALEAKLDD